MAKVAVTTESVCSDFAPGFTEIDTTWFGFDAPTRFNAWEVLNPIGIKVELVAKRS